MGCIFAKSKPAHYSSNGIRNIQIGMNASNGKRKSDQTNTAHSSTDTVDGNHNTGKSRRVNGRHVTKTVPRDPKCLSPRPPLTGPPTPEEDRHPMTVQYAEDLQPVSPLPDVITVATLHPKGNNVHVSSVKMKQPELRKQVTKGHTMLSNNDVTIEDLDSELDQLSRYSPNRYPTQTGERINPAITDVLLPRRKLKQVEAVDSELNDKPELTASGETAKKNVTSKKKGKKKKRKQTSNQSSEVDNSQPLDISIKTVEDVATELDVTDMETTGNNATEPEIKTKDNENKDIEAIEKKRDVIGNSSNNVEVVTQGAIEDSENRAPSVKSLESRSVFVPKDLYQKELEKERLKRKRKHVQARRPNKTSHVVKQENGGKTDEELKAGLKASRPGSVSSMWTIESQHSFMSQSSVLTSKPPILHATASTTRADVATPPSRFSYVPTGTTPLSFTQDSLDQDAQIVDLETDHELDDAHGDNVTISANVMDPFYGIKPYTKESEVLDKKTTDDVTSGSSTSYMQTKQKLMYSRFARRPTSETYPRLEGKPPIPPGSTLRMRPNSETNRGHTVFSRYFTTDLDIH